MVAQNNVHGNLMYGQFMQEADKIKLCRQIMRSAVINIAGNKECMHALIYGKPDNLLKSPQRCVADNPFPPVIKRRKTAERAAQM